MDPGSELVLVRFGIGFVIGEAVLPVPDVQYLQGREVLQLQAEDDQRVDMAANASSAETPNPRR